MTIFFPEHLSAILAARPLFVCFHNQGRRVFEVAPDFGKGLALCMARNLLDKGDIPFPALFDDGGKLPPHLGILAEIASNGRNEHPRTAKRARPN
jgi:hypothetical protein